MAIIPQDVLRANLVLVGVSLLHNQEGLDAFLRSIGTEVLAGVGLVTNTSSGVTEQGSTFTLPKDRITLDIFKSRSTITREYPHNDHLGKLAEVAGHAIMHTKFENQQLRAFGYNIDLIYDQDTGQPAVGYLAERLFANSPSLNEDWKLTGGSGQLIFSSDSKRWTVRVAPRLNDEESTRVFLSLNLHIIGESVPTNSEIRDSLQETWDQAHNFAHHLDRMQ